MSALSLGNPHAVLRVPDVKTAQVELWGPSVQRHPHFPPSRQCGLHANSRRNHILLRVFERGAGEKLKPAARGRARRSRRACGRDCSTVK